ncbi:Leucine-rich repeat-containing protein 37A2 [Manis javanica]|nr:Leucine-rich repeat-containing protein 37A2 [Manis javanica]
MKPVHLAVTLTPEVTNEVDPSPAQQEALAQPLESPEEAEPPPIQQEVPTQAAQPPEEVEPFPVQHEAPTQAPEFPAWGYNSNSTQQEAPPPNGAEPSPAQQETSAKPQSLLQRLSLLQENRNNQLSLLSLTGKLNLLQPRRRPQLSLQGPLNETESSTQQETPANFPEKQPLAEPLKPLKETESCGTEQEVSAYPPKPTEEVKTPLTQQEDPALSPVPQEESATSPEPRKEGSGRAARRPCGLRGPVGDRWKVPWTASRAPHQPAPLMACRALMRPRGDLGVRLFPGSVVCLLFLGMSGVLRESLDCEAWVGLQLQRLHGKCLLIS